MISRRDLVNGIIAGTALSTLAHSHTIEESTSFSDTQQTSDQPATDRPWGTVDSNIHLFQWPFRKLPNDSIQGLLSKLDKLDIRQAWSANFEGLLHRDVAGVNERLADACREHGQGKLQPVGTINLGLPDWEDDLRRCDEMHRMFSIRVYPNYHDYTLDDPQFTRLLRSAADRRMLVQICVSLEDRRTQHPRLRADDVVLAPLKSVIELTPHARVQLLNHKLTAATILEYANLPQISFDIARVEGLGTIARLVSKIGSSRILFGSHAPMFIPESALIKLYESDLSDGVLREIMGENANQLLGSKRSAS